MHRVNKPLGSGLQDGARCVAACSGALRVRIASIASGFMLYFVSLFIVLPVQALENDWYLGLGGGTSWLVPNPVDPGIDDDDNAGTYGTFLLGKDLGDLSSVQLQLHSLGETDLTNGETVEYAAADASVLYRLYDSRDNSLNRNGFGIALYGRVGIGTIDREIGVDLPLKNDSQFYFGAGAGAEVFLFGPLALRLEAMILDRDVQLGSLSLIARFGGDGSGRSARPPVPGSSRTGASTAAAPSSTAPATVPTPNPGNNAPAPAPAPQISAQSDSDADGVPDDLDECPDSRSGYPVQSVGCPIINGVLSGVVFADRSGTLLPQSFEQLDYLSNLLKRFPQARIQIHAHTDSTGTPREQATITRARLRTLGTYMVRQGVSANRLVLRSFGGQNPLYDNASAEGRAGNNRIEVLEQR